MSDTLAVPPREVVEAALSALAKKLRAELALGLLEDFAAGRCTARVMLAEYRRAERTLVPPRPRAPTAADRGLEDLVAAADAAGVAGGPAVQEARRYVRGESVPHWDRLRQVSRDRGRPAEEWEIFTALHKLAPYNGRSPSGRPLDLQDIEEAMPVHGGLGEAWSLHEYLRETRARFGPAFRPAAPELVAGIILRVDLCRQLLKPGGYTAGIAPGPPAPTRAIDPATMRELSQNVQRAVADEIGVAFALRLLDGRSGAVGPKPPAAELGRALATGTAIVRANTAREMAERARTRAAELRGQQLSSAGTALYATAITAGLGMAAVSLLAGARFQITAIIGLVLSGLGAAANLVKDWTPNAPVLVAPLRSWVTEAYATSAGKLERSQVDQLHRGGSPTAPQRAAAVFDTARAGALEAASRRLDPGRRARTGTQPPAPAAQPPRPASSPRHRAR